jgi:hypothetical protein
MPGATGLVEVNPNAAAPIAAIMPGFAPPIIFALFPFPIVLVNPEAEFGLVLNPLFHPPAVAFVITDYSRGGTWCSDEQAGCGDHRYTHKFHDYLLLLKTTKRMGSGSVRKNYYSVQSR